MSNPREISCIKTVHWNVQQQQQKRISRRCSNSTTHILCWNGSIYKTWDTYIIVRKVMDSVELETRIILENPEKSDNGVTNDRKYSNILKIWYSIFACDLFRATKRYPTKLLLIIYLIIYQLLCIISLLISFLSSCIHSQLFHRFLFFPLF